MKNKANLNNIFPADEVYFTDLKNRVLRKARRKAMQRKSMLYGTMMLAAASLLLVFFIWNHNKKEQSQYSEVEYLIDFYSRDDIEEYYALLQKQQDGKMEELTEPIVMEYIDTSLIEEIYQHQN